MSSVKRLSYSLRIKNIPELLKSAVLEVFNDDNNGFSSQKGQPCNNLYYWFCQELSFLSTDIVQFLYWEKFQKFSKEILILHFGINVRLREWYIFNYCMLLYFKYFIFHFT